MILQCRVKGLLGLFSLYILQAILTQRRMQITSLLGLLRYKLLKCDLFSNLQIYGQTTSSRWAGEIVPDGTKQFVNQTINVSGTQPANITLTLPQPVTLNPG